MHHVLSLGTWQALNFANKQYKNEKRDVRKRKEKGVVSTTCDPIKQIKVHQSIHPRSKKKEKEKSLKTIPVPKPIVTIHQRSHIRHQTSAIPISLNFSCKNATVALNLSSPFLHDPEATCCPIALSDEKLFFFCRFSPFFLRAALPPLAVVSGNGQW